MGKSRKKRKQYTTNPYDTGNLEDILADINHGNESSQVPTRGHILQRHKKEYKQMRYQVAELMKKRLKFSKKDTSAKVKRKTITKEIRDLENELRDRHAKELEAFDDSAKLLEKKQSDGDKDEVNEKMDTEQIPPFPIANPVIFS